MKNPTRFYFLLLFTLVALGVQLQAQNRITGTVTTSEGDPLPYANVLLLSASDSSLVKGQVSGEEGTYRLDGLPAGEYVVAIDLIGYAAFRYPPLILDGAPGTREMGTQVLGENSALLSEVEVVAKKPLFEAKVDHLVVNVANTITTAGSTALEVLERSPGVVVDRRNNAVSISGKNGVVVMINGRINYMSASAVVQLLAGMSADNIEKIEIYTTPPARFDAEGNAGYINIVLKSNPDEGLNGSYSLSAGYGKGETGNAGVNFNYRKGKINLYGDYGYLRDAREQYFQFNRSIVLQDEFYQTFSSSLRSPLQQNHTGRLGLDIQVSDKTVVGALFSSYDTKWAMDAANKSRTTIDGVPDQRIDVAAVELNQWRHYGGNFNVQHTFREGETLNFDADILSYRDNNPTDYDNRYLDGAGNLDTQELTRSRKVTPIRIGVSKLDYGRTLSEKVQLTAGLKGTMSSFTNDVAVETWRNQDWAVDPDLTAKYELREQILAAYSALDIKLGSNTSAKVGLRYEYTDSNLGAVEEENIVDRQYGLFFPSIFLSQTIDPQNAINLSYSRRITRPTFNDMAPFVLFLDPTTFFSGNPALQPAIADNFKVDYRWKSTLISLQYSQEDSTIVSFQSRIIPGTNDQLMFADNLQGQKTASLTVSVPYAPRPWWNVFVNAAGLWQRAGIYQDDQLTFVELGSVNVFSSHTFTLPSDWTLEVSGFYNSGALSGAFLMKSFGAVNLGVQKKFAEGNSTLRLGVDNVFDTMRMRMSSDIPELQQRFSGNVLFARPTVKVSYNHSFGNRKMKSQRNRETGSQEERARMGN